MIYIIAKETLKTGQEQFPDDPMLDYNMACYYSLTGNLTKSLDALQKAVAEGYKKFQQITIDPDLKNLRQSKQYKVWKKTLL